MRSSGNSTSALLRRSNGAAIIELAIVLPVLILIMIGTIQLGRLLSQIIGTSTTNYEALRTGAELNEDIGPSNMNWVFADVMRENYLQSGTTRFSTNNLTSAQYNTATRSITTSSAGEALNIFNYLDMGFHASYTGPVLLTNFDSVLGDLNIFKNAGCPEGEAYNCDGICDAPDSTPCGGIVLPPPEDGPACFSGDTPITMADGSQKAIRLARTGDLVLAFDTETGSRVPARVLHTIHRIRPVYMLLNDSLRVTPRHRFYLSGAWTAAESLRRGDALFTVTGEKSALRSIQKIEGNLHVYNLTVENFHNYYAGGFLVHNAKPDILFSLPD